MKGEGKQVDKRNDVQKELYEFAAESGSSVG